jgi:O-antigen/teichoic acid export membrane protein
VSQYQRQKTFGRESDANAEAQTTEDAIRVTLVVSKKIVLVNAASSLGSRLLNAVLLLWTQYYLLHRIAPEEYAVYPVVATMIFLLPIAAALLATPCNRHVTFALASGDEAGARELFSTSTAIMAGVGVIVLVGGGLVAWHVDRVFVVAPQYAEDARLMMLLVVVAGALDLALVSHSTCFVATQRLVLANVIAFTGDFMRFLVLMVLLLGVGPRVLWIAVAHLIGTVFVAFARVYVGRRILPALEFDRQAIRPATIAGLLSFGAQDLVVQMSRVLRGVSTVWILNRFAGPVDVASFHLGQSVYRQTYQAWMPIRGALMPPLIAMSAAGANDRLRSVYYRGGRIGLWITMIIVTPLVVFRDQIVRLFAGETYIVAASVLGLLISRVPFELVNNLFPIIARARGNMRPLARAVLAVEFCGVLVVLAGVASGSWGVVGAAAASMATTMIGESMVVLPLALRTLGGNITSTIKQTVVPGLAPALVATIAWYGARELLAPSSWLEVCLAIAPGIVVYAVATFAFLEPQDRQDLRVVIQRLRGRIDKREVE